MIINHICVNYGTPLFSDFFIKLGELGIKQNVFYPRRRMHRAVIELDGIKIDAPLILSLLTRYLYFLKRRRMRSFYEPEFRNNLPNILHAHTLFSDGHLAYYLSKRYSIPYIVAVRSSDIDTFLRYRKWLKPLGKRILCNAKKIIFISPSLMNKTEKLYNISLSEKSEVVGNGIDSYFFERTLEKKSLCKDDPKLLYVGNFQKRKKVPNLIDFVLKNNHQLTIIGEGGKDMKKVTDMIKGHRKIKYIGPVHSKSEIARHYKEADIFIMPSVKETFGLVYIEAMSQGTPLIYGRNTGIDGLFEEGTIGIAVNQSDISSWEEAIWYLVDNYERLSNNCIAEAKKFEWENIAEKYLSIYRDIVK